MFSHSSGNYSCRWSTEHIIPRLMEHQQLNLRRWSKHKQKGLHTISRPKAASLLIGPNGNPQLNLQATSSTLLVVDRKQLKEPARTPDKSKTAITTHAYRLEWCKRTIPNISLTTHSHPVSLTYPHSQLTHSHPSSVLTYNPHLHSAVVRVEGWRVPWNLAAEGAGCGEAHVAETDAA